MSSTLIDDYVAGLHRRLPGPIAEEAAGGLIETYQDQLSRGASDDEAARAAVAEFGEASLVVAEFVRQAPGRRAARLLLVSGPVVGACWAAALVISRAWIWPVPGVARLSFGCLLLVAVMALAAAATSRRSYPRTMLAAAASPVILILDATAVTAVLIAAPALTWALVIAVSLSLARIALTARALPRIAAR